MNTTRAAAVTARNLYCDSLLDGCFVPESYWNRGMEITRGLLRGGSCTRDHCIVSATDTGDTTIKGCWTSATQKRGRRA